MSNNNDDQNPIYTVGYGKPPKHSRFQKGHTGGNRKGRPKGSKNFSTLLHAELNKRIPFKVDGKERKITKLEAFIMRFVNGGVTGKSKNIPLLVQEIHDAERKMNGSAAAPAAQPDSDFRPETIEEAAAKYSELMKNAKPAE